MAFTIGILNILFNWQNVKATELLKKQIVKNNKIHFWDRKTGNKNETKDLRYYQFIKLSQKMQFNIG